MPDPAEVIEEAARLLRDGAAGYTTASERIGNEELRAVMVEMAARRRVLADEVVRQAVESGVWVAHSGGSLEGRIHRAWMALESLIGDDATVLASVRDAERSTSEDLAALDLEEVPDAVRTAVEDGADHVSTCSAALEALDG